MGLSDSPSWSEIFANGKQHFESISMLISWKRTVFGKNIMP